MLSKIFYNVVWIMPMKQSQKKLNLAMTYYAFMHAALQKMIDDSPDKGEPWHV